MPATASPERARTPWTLCPACAPQATVYTLGECAHHLRDDAVDGRAWRGHRGDHERRVRPGDARRAHGPGPEGRVVCRACLLRGGGRVGARVGLVAGAGARPAQTATVATPTQPFQPASIAPASPPAPLACRFPGHEVEQ
eukprot:6342935-Prymnesium_polylepis.2